MICENKLRVRYSMMLRLWTKNDKGDQNHDDSHYKMDARPEARMPPCSWNRQGEAIARHRGCFSEASGRMAGARALECRRVPPLS